MINPACEVDAGHYKDNFNGVYAIDHVTLQTTEDPSVVADDSGDLELYRSALQRALQAYVSSKFRCELTAGTVAMKDGKLHAYICSEKPNLRNFWSGKWTSSWAITMDSNSCSISGDIKVMCSCALMYSQYVLNMYHDCYLNV